MTKMRYYAIWLSLICIAVFILQVFIPGFTGALILNSRAYVQPYRFVSAIFLHGSLMHLLYNLFALLFFGLILEKFIGGKKFMAVFFVSGVLANLLAFFIYPASLGASGAIFGIIGVLTVIKPFMIIWAFYLPMPMILATVLWTIGNIFQTFAPSNIGTIAHLSGLIIGMLFGFLFMKNVRIRKEFKKQRVKIPESYMRRWEDNWLR